MDADTVFSCWALRPGLWDWPRIWAASGDDGHQRADARPRRVPQRRSGHPARSESLMEFAQRTCSRLRTRRYPRSWQCRWSWSPSRRTRSSGSDGVRSAADCGPGGIPAASRQGGECGPRGAAALLAVAAYLQPVKQEIGFGQVDLLLLALCAVDCLVDSPRWPRGLLIGLATAIKLEPGVFISTSSSPGGAARRERRRCRLPP